MYLLKKNIFVNYLYIILISLFNIYSLPLNSTEHKKDINTYNSVFAIEEKKIYDYILGAGDELRIIFLGLRLFNGIYKVKPNGNILLPELDEIKVQGKTLKELRIYLTNKYKEYIINPELLIEIVKYRPVYVTLRGEVNKTGLFKIPFDKSNKYNPRLFDALKLGKGITSNADLTNIIVVRNNPAVNGGGKIKANINIITFLDKGDQTQNIQLRDGDDIYIGKSNNTIIEQLNLFNKSNLSPSKITVFLNGNVMKSGSLKISQGASLYEAIAAAGEKSLSGTIELVRLSNSGANERRSIAYNKKSPKGSYENPFLIDGDIVTVRKNILGKTTQAIKEYGAPIINSYAIYKIFDKL